MRFRVLAAAVLMGLCLTTHAATKKHKSTAHAAAGTSHKASTKKAGTHGRSSKHSSKSGKSTASHAPMAPERASAIQTALINNGYMSGTPSGAWDAQSQAAMQKLQSDNGWQTKIVPDSRALIKLGLGPQPAAAPLPKP